MKMHGSTLDFIAKTVMEGLLSSLHSVTSLWSGHLRREVQLLVVSLKRPLLVSVLIILNKMASSFYNIDLYNM